MAIEIGQHATLIVRRLTSPGAFLGEDASEQEVLLPTRYVPSGTQVDDRIRVFVYTDSEDRPVATTQTPLAVVGQFAFLEVVDVSEHGVFLDWGLDKDLFAPTNEQQDSLTIGDWRVFAVALDLATDRVMAASRLKDYLDLEPEDVKAGDAVELLVYGRTDIGTRVVVDGRYSGIVYDNETYAPMKLGDRLDGFVHLVRDDGKLDIRLFRTGKKGIDDAREVLLRALEEHGGFLPLHDKSDPEDIRRELAMSKKSFKRALGGLYRARRVTLHDDGVRLVASNASS